MKELKDVSFSERDASKSSALLRFLSVAVVLMLGVFAAGSIFVNQAHAAAPDPKGAFGFTWGESAEKVKTKAGSMKMAFVRDNSGEDRVLVYTGETGGYNGLFIFRCKGDKLFAVTLTVKDDQSYKTYEKMLAETTAKYGKPNDHTEREGITVSGWQAGGTMVNVGKFSSKSEATGEAEYITSSVYINMAMADVPTGKK